MNAACTTAAVLTPSWSEETFETAQGEFSPEPSKPDLFIEEDANTDPREPDLPVQEHPSPVQVRTIGLRSQLSSAETPIPRDHFYSEHRSPERNVGQSLDPKDERRYRVSLQHRFHPSCTSFPLLLVEHVFEFDFVGMQ